MPRRSPVTTLLMFLVVAGLLVGTGCTTREVGRVGPEPRTAISYAATAAYPGQAPGRAREPGPYQLAAVVDPRDREIEIANLGVNAVPASTIWINKTFVHRSQGLQPMSVRTLKYGQFLEAGSGVRDLDGAGQQPRLIELETDEGLLVIPGPAYR